MEYKILQEYAKERGFKSVTEAITTMGWEEFRRGSIQFSLSEKQPYSLKMEIKKIGSRWLVNGKQLKDCSDWEKEFMNRFFKEVRTENLI